jgi:hypothetical protein
MVLVINLSGIYGGSNPKVVAGLWQTQRCGDGIAIDGRWYNAYANEPENHRFSRRGVCQHSRNIVREGLKYSTKYDDYVNDVQTIKKSIERYDPRKA